MASSTPAVRRPLGRAPFGAGPRAVVRKIGVRLIVPAILIAIWQSVGNDDRLIDLPTFTRTMSSLGHLAADGELFHSLAASNWALLWGYLVALGIALPLGLLTGTSRIARAAAAPYLSVALILPLIAVIPLLQAIFGLGVLTRSVVVVLFAFPYTAINVQAGVRSVPGDLIEMARSFGTSGWTRLTHVTLPHAFPFVMAGARLGLGRGVVGMVIAELYLVSSGVGSLLQFYSDRFNAGAVFAIALSLVLEGVVLMTLARLVEFLATRRHAQ